MKKQKPKVSIIITNYNGGQVFWDCLVSVEKIDYSNFEVIVVDDGSKDGSFGKAKRASWKATIKFFKNKKNLGFAGANNRGCGESDGDYILLLNNDTTVDKKLLTKLVERLELDLSIGVAQAKIFMMDKPGYLDNAGAFLTKTGFLSHWGFGKKDSEEYTKEREIFSAKGACMFIRRNVVEKLGLFDADYVSYMEETDFCWRVWLAGWRIIFFPETYIYHKVGFTFSNQCDPIVVNYNSFKNRILMLYKCLDTKNLFMIFVPHIILVTCLGFYYLFTLQFDKARMIYNSFVWNIKNISNAVKKRKRVQKIRVKTDNELFEVILQKTSFIQMFANFLRVENDMKNKN
ncbi:MAG: glycosyltransferase family 2 protein [bacterium]